MNTFENINFGRKDGVEVHLDEKNNQVIVLAPNQYDLVWQLKGKNQAGEPYSTQLKSDETKKIEDVSWVVKKKVEEFNKKAIIIIPASNLDSPEKQQYFNNKVNKTRERVVEAAQEYNSFFYKKDPDGTYKTKTMSDKIDEYNYKAAWEQSGDRTAKFHFSKNDPKNPVLAGEVAHAGKYYTVFFTGFDKDNIKFEIMNTGKFLKGEQLKDQNREKAIAEILPVGEKVFIDRDRLGNVLEVSKTEIDLAKNHPELVAVAKAVEAVKTEQVQSNEKEKETIAPEEKKTVVKKTATKKATQAVKV